MISHQRDRAVVSLIARFKQASASQVAAVLFDGLSPVPANRTLRRLTERGYLVRVERRLSGGASGGSGQYVYALGKLGHELHNQGSRYHVPRSVNHHALAILDTYIIIRQKHLDNRLIIKGVSTEPDCHQQVGRVLLKPDLYLDMLRPDNTPRRYWFEIDMGTESQARIREKLARYWRAYTEPAAASLAQWPLVVFVTVDRERAEELSWLIRQEKPEARQLFRVATLKSLEGADL